MEINEDVLNSEMFDSFDSLPYREPVKRVSLRRTYHKVNGLYPNDHALNCCKKFLGKSVNMAFKEYCKRVRKDQQNFFWKLFKEEEEHYNWDRQTNYKFFRYYLDSDGIICTYPYMPSRRGPKSPERSKQIAEAQQQLRKEKRLSIQKELAYKEQMLAVASRMPQDERVLPKNTKFAWFCTIR